MKMTKRCAVCTRFGLYDGEDSYCIACGHDALATCCRCGRGYDYALDEPGDLHCPRCGCALRGRSAEFRE